MQDFDKIRLQRIGTDEERSFQLLGHVFVARPAVKPEVLTRYENLSTEDGGATALETIDELVLAMIEPGDGDWVNDPRKAAGDDGAVPQIGPDHAKYLEFRANEDGESVLSLGDLQDIVQWLVERQSGNPSGPRSNSSAGRALTGDGSTADSRLRVARG